MQVQFSVPCIQSFHGICRVCVWKLQDDSCIAALGQDIYMCMSLHVVAKVCDVDLLGTSPWHMTCQTFPSMQKLKIICFSCQKTNCTFWANVKCLMTCTPKHKSNFHCHYSYSTTCCHCHAKTPERLLSHVV